MDAKIGTLERHRAERAVPLFVFTCLCVCFCLFLVCLFVFVFRFFCFLLLFLLFFGFEFFVPRFSAKIKGKIRFPRFSRFLRGEEGTNIGSSSSRFPHGKLGGTICSFFSRKIYEDQKAEPATAVRRPKPGGGRGGGTQSRKTYFSISRKIYEKGGKIFAPPPEGGNPWKVLNTYCLYRFSDFPQKK